jgi:hypothetical protein
MSVSTRRHFLGKGGLAVAASLLAGTARGETRVWVDEQTCGPFHCKAAFPLDGLSEFFGELARLEQELQRTLAVPRTEDNVDVFLLADERAHRRFLSDLYPRAPYRRALYVQRGGRGAVYAYQHGDLAVDLRHECTHALLHASLPAVPLWLDEGLAEYFEMPEAERAFHHPHLSLLRWRLRLGQIKTIESLEAAQELGDMGSLEYRYAWAWVHFMLHGPAPAHRALVDYLADVRRGHTPAPLSHRLRAVTPNVENRMVQHFQHWQRSSRSDA